jgi:hypothetical protein
MAETRCEYGNEGKNTEDSVALPEWPVLTTISADMEY